MTTTKPSSAHAAPPDRWLQARCLVLERGGLSPRSAIIVALDEWREQEELAATAGVGLELAVAVHPRKEVVQ